MSVRHAALSIGALLVLGLGVYLFVEVRAQPVAPVAVRSEPSAPVAAPTEPPAEPTGPIERPPSFVPPMVAPTPRAVAREVAAPPTPPPDAPTGVPMAPTDDPMVTGTRLEAVMDEANKAYDRGDYDDAKTIASRLLARIPGNIRMLRILVSVSCIEGDSATAQTHYTKLPQGDQAQMRVRCARYGVSFSDRP